MNAFQNTSSSTRTTTTRRVVPALAATVLVLGLGTLPASARQDAGAANQEPEPLRYSIQRVGTQYVAGDNLTGNDVPAPGWVDER